MIDLLGLCVRERARERETEETEEREDIKWVWWNGSGSGWMDGGRDLWIYERIKSSGKSMI